MQVARRAGDGTPPVGERQRGSRPAAASRRLEVAGITGTVPSGGRVF